MDAASKARENRLRAVALRQGLRLMKNTRRDPRAIDYGGWMITDARDYRIVFGGSPEPFNATLDEVEAYLSSDAARERRRGELAAS